MDITYNVKVTYYPTPWEPVVDIGVFPSKDCAKIFADKVLSILKTLDVQRYQVDLYPLVETGS